MNDSPAVSLKRLHFVEAMFHLTERQRANMLTIETDAELCALLQTASDYGHRDAEKSIAAEMKRRV